MLGLPEPTQFDLRFRLLGIPVRVNPFFWAMAAFLGWQSHDGFQLVIWIGCVFVSVMVHEFGHALTGRYLSRQRPAVILYYMGGLCVPDRDDRSPWRRIAVLLMGPGAGFLLLAATMAVGAAAFGFVGFGEYQREIHEVRRFGNPTLIQIYIELQVINLLWGLFNLLPIFPLDGGQIASVLLSMGNRREGPRRAHGLSIAVAALVAYYLYTRGQTYNAFMILMLGLFNFQLLQATRYEGRYASQMDEEDADWWKR